MNRVEHLANDLARDHSVASSSVCGWHIVGIIVALLLVLALNWLSNYIFGKTNDKE